MSKNCIPVIIACKKIIIKSNHQLSYLDLKSICIFYTLYYIKKKFCVVLNYFLRRVTHYHEVTARKSQKTDIVKIGLVISQSIAL